MEPALILARTLECCYRSLNKMIGEILPDGVFVVCLEISNRDKHTTDIVVVKPAIQF